MYGIRLPEPLMRDVNTWRWMMGNPMNELVEEALHDLVKKYREKRRTGR